MRKRVSRFSENWDQVLQIEEWKTEEHVLLIDYGYFEHVCPPWFAPQFAMMICTNVETMTTNIVGLQQYEPKVVYVLLMTNKGKRILIQTHLTWSACEKPFLSTSSLKHRHVTIIFNQHYERIIVRNETMNLVSHDCNSYLHVVLTNGIPLSKALVIAGECDKWRGRRSLQ